MLNKTGVHFSRRVHYQYNRAEENHVPEEQFVSKALLAISGILLGALLTWASTFYFQTRKEKADQKRLLTVLFGELLNIRQHYTFAYNELPSTISSQADLLSLKMSRYGPLAFSGSDLAHLGFLSNEDVRDLMQLSLVVRNTDYSIDIALEDIAKAESDFARSKEELTATHRRMKYALAVTERLITAIAQRNSHLKSILPKRIA